MIAYITGELLAAEADHLVVLTPSGVGYAVHTPLPTAAKLARPGAPVALHVATVVREDALLLFGFESLEEKRLFGLLITVSGIGPKAAMALLSALEPAALIQAITLGDDRLLAKAPGIGKKTAGRLCLELAEKVGQLSPGGPTPAPAQQAADGGQAQVRNELLSALTHLGFNEKEVLPQLNKLDLDQPFDTLVKQALSGLTGR